MNAMKRTCRTIHLPENDISAKHTGKISVFAAIVATCAVLCGCNDNNMLRVFTPPFNDIELHCDSLEPDFSDDCITLACSAAFTKDFVPFSHENIIGSHVSHGVLYRRDSIRENRGTWGVFTYYDGHFSFDTNNFTEALKKAATHDGMGFMQYMVVHDGTACRKWRTNIFKYRVLCDIDDTLRIVESVSPMPYSDFVDSLMTYKPKNAIYLDMGGWDYCKYRNSNGEIVDNGRKWHKMSTNCIVFRKQTDARDKKNDTSSVTEFSPI